MKAPATITALCILIAASTAPPQTGMLGSGPAGSAAATNSPDPAATGVVGAGLLGWSAESLHLVPAADPLRRPIAQAGDVRHPGEAEGTVAAGYEIYGASREQARAIEDAIALFDRADLTLPVIRIYVHQTDEPCHGYLGLFGEGGDKHRIDICMSHPFVIRHELAHAWEYHGIEDSKRQAFLEQVGIEEWNDQDQPRQLRAIEKAADLIAWGIDRQPIQTIHRTVYAEDLAGYEFLTGSPSPRISHWKVEPARGSDMDSRIGVAIDVTLNAAWR